MLFGARHGDSEHGARSTFIFAASLARSRPRSRRLSSRRALRAARQVLEFLSESFSRTIAPLDALISIPKAQIHNEQEDARVTFVALYHFRYSLRRLLNRLINLLDRRLGR